MNVNTNPSPKSATHGGTERSESGTRFGSQIPEMTPEMVKMASDRMKNMSPEELQKMFELASSMNLNGTSVSNSASADSTQRSESGSQSSTAEGSHTADHLDVGESSSGGLFSNSRNSQVSSSLPSSSADLQESLRNSMKDPAMRQKNISPEMMANMSEQYGMKLSRGDAAKVQEAMSSLSPEDLDKMLRRAERAQQGVETARRTKNWLLRRPGLILAFVMLILAFVSHRLGFIGG